MRWWLIGLMSCATPHTPPPLAPVPSKPHIVEYDGRSVSCPKTSTALGLNGEWTAEGDGSLVLLRRKSCRAVLIVRAGRLSDRDNSFDLDWAAARAHVQELPEPKHAVMRAHAAEIGIAHTMGSGISFRYELDQLASLSCTFLIAGDSACVGEPFTELTRAPGALRMPEPKEGDPPTRNMGPSPGAPTDSMTR